MASKDTDRQCWWGQMGRAFRREWHIIFSDMGVMLFFIALPLLYPITYTLIYNPEIVTEMPTAVVDHSMTPSSRKLVRAIDASPSVALYSYCPEMGEARRLYAERKVDGIIEIPADYEKRIMRGEQECSRSRTVMVVFDKEHQQSVDVPEAWRRILCPTEK